MQRSGSVADTSGQDPPAFLWGVATSAYQSEGGYNAPGQPQTNWALAERRKLVAPIGRAAEFWRYYQEDFATCRRLGLNAFRLSVEWSRVQPSFVHRPGTPPGFDAEALDHYARIIGHCMAQGLEPIVTLHHFVHPAWLGQDPWLTPSAVEHFEVYVRAAVLHINRSLVARGQSPVRYYITINEPNMLVLNTYLGSQFPTGAERGLKSAALACNQLLRAHVLAYNCIHDLYAAEGWGRPMVTLNNFTSDVYWWDKLLFDLLAMRERRVSPARVMEYIREKFEAFGAALALARMAHSREFSHYSGKLLRKVSEWFAARALSPGTFRPFIQSLLASPRARVMDYLAIDYYDPFCAHAIRLPRWRDLESRNDSLRAWFVNSMTSKWWDWRVLPEGLRFFCEYYVRDFEGRPLLIAENGMALRRSIDNRSFRRRDRVSRSEFIEMHAREVLTMVRNGTPLLGYMHWSLFDNYEWGTYSPRFGLFSLDYQQDAARIAIDPHGDCPSATYARVIRESATGLWSEPARGR